MKIGVLGLGRIGVMHARNLAQTAGVDEVVLIGRDASRLAAAHSAITSALAPGAPAVISGLYAPGHPAAELSTTLEPVGDLLPTLDGIVVATATVTHPEIALQVASAGVPLLIEKPLSLQSEALSALSDELDATGTPVMVGFHRRYDPGYRSLRTRITAGEVGALRIVHAVDHDHYPLPLAYIPESRGMWIDLLVHDFDIIPWVTGERVVSVQATGSVIDEQTYALHGDTDTATALLEFESGALATVSGTRRNGAGQDVRLEVFGSEGSLVAGLDTRTPITSTEPGVVAPEHPYREFSDRFEPAFRQEVAEFLRMVRGEVESLTPPRAGLHATQIAEAAAESFRSGSRVSLP